VHTLNIRVETEDGDMFAIYVNNKRVLKHTIKNDIRHYMQALSDDEIVELQVTKIVRDKFTYDEVNAFIADEMRAQFG
jgi:hypothetical protein